ncbi:hypothetical protein [Flagellimonas aequoris]|uniref:Uncharacterized protein n=2 Tax=Flagellimonas aequoris TaxID=2306997 RepID=A0ABY3KVH9_9FLAO|nr:hypothetical protein [Allomuricauda aequoris]TXK03825.1 hypothetical protein FQ019_06220 [Allomuricauda aequoris]
MTVRWNAIFDIVLPFLVAGLCYVLMTQDLLVINRSFLSDILSVLGIIAGFSVTAIALLATSDSEGIKELKQKQTGLSVDGIEISAFRRFYILVSYSVLISFIAILINVIGYLIPWSQLISQTAIMIIKSLNLWMIFHIFFINIRNISSLYFVYFTNT